MEVISMSGRIEGVFAPITTPFEHEEVAYARLKANLEKYKKTPLSGFLVLGSNGENKTLTEQEKLKILEILIETKSPSQLIMAGTGYESTKQTIAFSKKAAELGADYVSLLTPSYFKKGLTDEAMIGYYTDVAEALSIPVLCYNAPGFTGMTISPKVIEVISRHPNIAGMKDTSPASMAEYLEICDSSFDVLSGTINTFFIGLALGASGGVVSLANAYPDPCCELYRRFKSGDIDGARKLHHTLFHLNHALSGRLGVAGVKYAMDVAGYCGGPPRLPLLPLKDEDKRKIEQALSEAGLR
jgi:4-hydroxy-2-oxoglutarate aldolase